MARRGCAVESVSSCGKNQRGGLGRTGATKAEFAELIVLILEYCDRRAAVFMEAVSSAIFNALRCLAFFTATHMSRAMTMTMRAPK